MLDWTGREYEVAPNRRERITFDDLTVALRVWEAGMSFPPRHVYIRDAFDNLFEAMNLLEHYLRTDLLDFRDVEFPMAYNVGKLREHWKAVGDFARYYGYDLALAFIDRFPDSSRGEQANNGIQPSASDRG
jgi:hypothetical protein